MGIKIETPSKTKLPRGTTEQLEKIIKVVPKEHLRGLERVRLVDTIADPRLNRILPNKSLPGLYHPKQGTVPAWIEISVLTLLPPSKSPFKRLLPRISFKGNLAAILFSLIGQHYYLTLRHSVKRGQLETSVRAYTEKHLKLWGAKEHTLRTRIFKPLQPVLERWARSVQKRANAKKTGKA